MLAIAPRCSSRTAASLLILALLGGGYWYLDYYNTNTSLATGQKVRFTVTHG